MEGSCSTGQTPQRAVVPVEEEEEEEEEVDLLTRAVTCWISNPRGLGFNHMFLLFVYAMSDGSGENGAGSCPSSFRFPLLDTLPPLIHDCLSPYDSLDQASSYYIPRF
jgi:hypothetical protein